MDGKMGLFGAFQVHQAKIFIIENGIGTAKRVESGQPTDHQPNMAVPLDSQLWRYLRKG
jgi:hypothetical protein